MKIYTKIILLVGLMLFIGVGGYFSVRQLIRNSITVSPIVAPSPTPIPPAPYTGDLSQPIMIPTKDEQFSKLVNSLPVNTQSFTISMDFANNIALVTIHTPQGENYAVFQKWLVDNGYNLIPPEKLKIVVSK